MEIRRGWTRQVAATALLVAACGAVGTAVAAFGDSAPTPPTTARITSGVSALALGAAELASKR